MPAGIVFRVSDTRWGTADAEIKSPLVGAQGYQRFPLSKPVYVVGQTLALNVVPAYLAYAFHAHSTSSSSNFSKSSMVERVLSSESKLYLW